MSIGISYRQRRLAYGLIIGLLFLIQSVIAQGSGSIKGSVVDNETGEVLIGANILIQTTSLGANSDLDGNFKIPIVPAGKWIIRVSFVGYAPVTREVTVIEDKTSEEKFRLTARAIMREAVIITAQVKGQDAAINQQLASNTISNIVARDRIKELPDVNAAESIGRLPGVSISRSGGEANRVSIRGLSPKYNTVTLNGVAVPATGGDDRSVDLSLISSTMLDGIELKKANTPDMDADAVGGTVDLRLKEAPENFEFNATAQAGYNQLQKYYGNYNFSANISDRFLEGDLGIIGSFNMDNFDRSADKFSGNYREKQTGGVTGIAVTSILLREEKVKRGRTGASLLLDYRIPYGKATLNSFFNRLNWDGLYRINRMNVNDNRHYYDLEDRGGITSIFTGALGVKQDFDWIKYDLNIARTGTHSDSPDDRTWTFAQENAAFLGVTNETRAIEVPTFATVDTNITGLSSMFIYGTRRNENQSSIQLNIQMPFHIADFLSGYVKFGGKLRTLKRNNDENQSGRDGLQYGSSTGLNQPLAVTLKNLAHWYPDQFNWPNDSTMARKYGIIPIWRFRSDYSRSDFLKNQYPLGYVVNEGLMNKMTEGMHGTAEWLPYAIGSRGRDYDGEERYQAAYFMASLNLGEYATLIPGVRFEQDYSKYHGQSYREATLNNIQAEPADLVLLENERKNKFWLPMLHLSIQPIDWIKIRFARTETLTRPDYIQYAPITSINVYQSYIRAANAELRPARSKNYDVAISIYENHIGLFSVSGFYKKIYDLIMQSTIYYQPGITLPEGLNIPSKWLANASPQIDTYTNNPYAAEYRGFEVEWQTNFWYLTSIFQGVVLNVNYTRIFSEIEKELFFVINGPQIPGTRPPRFSKILVDSSRFARMPDQPKHIANVTLGYDYEGFSARLSYLYQTDKTTFISLEPILDNFSGTYARWDLTLQQNIGWGIQLFANFTNLNNRPDENFRGYTLTDPAYIEYYGFSSDVGIRYRF
ncbi:MAG: carboxypeptidase-like regulatory domain-containing protein [bacterium]